MIACDIEAEVATLQQMTVNQLSKRYEELFNEPCRSRHKRYLVRRIAWRMQARAEGDLTERARQRANDLADDAEIRVTPPRSRSADAPPTARCKRPTTVVAGTQDRRLPPPGNWIVRKYKGRTISVRVLRDEFEFEGERFKSLSAVAKKVTGSHLNGFRFFGLGGEA